MVFDYDRPIILSEHEFREYLKSLPDDVIPEVTFEDADGNRIGGEADGQQD